MRKQAVITVAAVVVLAVVAGAAAGGRAWSVNHARRMSGSPESQQANCFYCHLMSTSRLSWARPHPRHAAPAGLAVSPDGRRLYIALDEKDQVVETDPVSRKILRTAKLSGAPTGLALDSHRERLYVTCRNDDRVRVLDSVSFAEVESGVAVGLAPVGIAVCETRSGPRLVVANSGSHDVSVLSLSPLKEQGRVGAGREPYAVTATPNGRAVVANRLAGLVRSPNEVPNSELTTVDPATVRIVSRQTLDSAHLSEAVAAVPSRAWALAPLVKIRNLVPITQVAQGWVMSSGLAISDLHTGQVLQIPLDEANDFFADPSGIAVDPAGHRAYIASGGADVVTVLDLDRLARWREAADDCSRAEAIDNLSLSAEYVLARLPVGRNPRQLELSPDGTRLFVAERLDDSVLVVDTTTLRALGRIRLGDGGLDDPIRRGERVFTRASNTFQHQFTCRSCHPDGHVDGLSYDFDADGIGSNLLDNRSLRGVAGTAPFKWNGRNPSLEVQCGPRFARVLMRTDPFSPSELKDLTAFVESLPPARTAYKHGEALTPAQVRGRQIFFASQTPAGKEIPRERRCSTCHRPPLYSNRLPTSVGTRGPADNSDLFDTPHLLGVGASAPYLHDGRAATLEEIWTVYSTNDLHGITSYMNKIQLTDLVEFLKTL